MDEPNQYLMLKISIVFQQRDKRNNKIRRARSLLLQHYLQMHQKYSLHHILQALLFRILGLLHHKLIIRTSVSTSIRIEAAMYGSSLLLTKNQIKWSNVLIIPRAVMMHPSPLLFPIISLRTLHHLMCTYAHNNS